MTVTKEMVMQVSPFSVSDSGDFDETDFGQYKIWAIQELNRIDPGVDSETYDRIHALMICHIYESSGDTAVSSQLQSEKIGDYSYTQNSEAIPGTTTYYDRILQIIHKWQLKQPTTSTERDDADDTYPSSEFALDQSNVGVFE